MSSYIYHLYISPSLPRVTACVATADVAFPVLLPCVLQTVLAACHFLYHTIWANTVLDTNTNPNPNP